MGKHLVLGGGGHAHLTAIVNIRTIIDRGHRVTLIAPSPYLYYSGMGPGMLGEYYRPDEIRFPIRHMAERGGATFVEAGIVRVDRMHGRSTFHRAIPSPTMSVLRRGQHDSHRAHGGDRRPRPAGQTHRESHRGPRFHHPAHGGDDPTAPGGGRGPRGCGNRGEPPPPGHAPRGEGAHHAARGLEASGRLSPKAAEYARASLGAREVRIIEGLRVNGLGDGRAVLSQGDPLPYDICFLAVGVKPSGVLEDSGLPLGEEGGLMVNELLQCTTHHDIFGGGDCVSHPHPLAKVGVYAVRQNMVLYHNLLAALDGGPLEPFDPGGAYLLIFNMGDGRGSS